MSNKMITKVEGQELILERVFNAPRELVFKAFSEAEHLKHGGDLAAGRLRFATLIFVRAVFGITA